MVNKTFFLLFVLLLTKGFPMTFAEARDRFRHLISPDDEIGEVIQEACDRAYEMGRWQGMVEEVRILPSDYIVNTDLNEVYLDFDLNNFNGAVGFRVKERGYDIYGQTKLYQGYGAGTSFFIDLNEVDVSGVTKRRYRCPIGWQATEANLVALMKKKSAMLTPTSSVPIKSVAALKRAILAVTLENVDEFEKADQHWGAFMQFMEVSEKQFTGNHKWSIHIDSGLRRRPTGFM